MGVAVRPYGHGTSGMRSRPSRSSRPTPVVQKGARFSMGVVLFFILASTAISIYDLALLFKFIMI